MAEDGKGPRELRAEAEHWRGLERLVDDAAVLAEIRRMIAALEERARQLEEAAKNDEEG